MIIRCFCGRKVGEFVDDAVEMQLPVWRRVVPTGRGDFALVRWAAGAAEDEPSSGDGLVLVCPRHGPLSASWPDMLKALAEGRKGWKVPRRGRSIEFRGYVEELPSARFPGRVVKVAVVGDMNHRDG